MRLTADVRAGEQAARLYLPAAGSSPLIVYLHGGGWTVSSLESHDRMCRRLADSSGAAVLALNYCLAPEHPWPASVERHRRCSALGSLSAGRTGRGVAGGRGRARLRDAGGEVQLRREPGLIHNFMLLDELSPACAAAADRVAANLRAYFSTHTPPPTLRLRH